MNTLTLKVQEIEQLTSGIKKFVFQAPNAADLPLLVRGPIDLQLETGSSNLFLGQRPERDQSLCYCHSARSRRRWRLDLHAR